MVVNHIHKCSCDKAMLHVRKPHVHARNNKDVVQSDQCLCYLLCGKYNDLTWCMKNFNFLASLHSRAGWFDPYLVTKSKTGFLTTKSM